MFQLGKTIVSEELLKEEFVCNISACKGECCVAGDAGAPLVKDEVGILENIFEKVKIFMKTFGQEIKKNSSLSSEKINKLRVSLIEEELDELKQAIKDNNIKEVADALTDILYVTYGAGHAFGIDLDKCFDEVQNSNMSKLGEDGRPIYNENGKVMKGPNYFKPNLAKFV